MKTIRNIILGWILGLLLVIPINAYPGSYLLNVPSKVQQASYLCWAACCESVLAYKNKTVSQTALSTYVFGTYSNSPATMSQTRNALSHYGLASNYSSTALTYNQIITQIYNDKRPAIIGLSTGGVGHMIVLYGYTDGAPQSINFMDPSNGNKYVGSYSYYSSIWNECIYAIR